MSDENAIIARAYKKQLRGWLSYAFASEVFAVVSLTLFLPICLEQFARDNGYLLPDKTERCSVQQQNAGIHGEEHRCVTKVAWFWVDTASFTLYVYSISVALQALTVISTGGIADRPPHRKSLLCTFAAMGSIASMLFLVLPASSPVWYLAAVLAAIANVSFGASIVAMNAYLPGLARESFEVVEARRAMLAEMDSPANPRPSGSNSDDTEDDAAPLLAGEHPNPEPSTSARGAYDTALSLATSRLSSLGVALGYSARILLLLLTLVPVTLLKGTTFSLRLAIGASGIWWALFSLPAFLWLPSGHTESTGQKWSFMKEVGAAWVKLGTMLRWREIKKLKNTFIYLAAWFLLSDGFTTITSTAILFAKTTLFMPASSLILIGVLTPSAGILGSFTAPIIQRRLKVSNLTVVVTLVILASLLPIYGCLGFIPAFRDGNVKFGGLTTPGEMFVLAVYFGGLYGAFQGYARAFYAELVPPGEEARWFALFSITDKSSSFLGPLIVGLIADATGNIRYAFFFLVGMIWAAVPILLLVNVPQGKLDAKAYSET